MVLVWDNSYSFFRPKHVAFIVRVLAPATQVNHPHRVDLFTFNGPGNTFVLYAQFSV